jgi:hypothetical protein
MPFFLHFLMCYIPLIAFFDVLDGTSKNTTYGIELVRHGFPWVPTDQAHGRPRQVGPAYYKTRQTVSGPNRPGWRPTRPPEDLPEDSPNDLVQHDHKTWRTRQDISGFRSEQIDR